MFIYLFDHSDRIRRTSNLGLPSIPLKVKLHPKNNKQDKKVNYITCFLQTNTNQHPGAFFTIYGRWTIGQLWDRQKPIIPDVLL
jgi:hypothetical protein